MNGWAGHVGWHTADGLPRGGHPSTARHGARCGWAHVILMTQHKSVGIKTAPTTDVHSTYRSLLRSVPSFPSDWFSYIARGRVPDLDRRRACATKRHSRSVGIPWTIGNNTRTMHTNRIHRRQHWKSCLHWTIVTHWNLHYNEAKARPSVHRFQAKTG